MEYALITIDEESEGFFLSATVAFTSERNAQTFTTIMRNMVVQKIRREGGKLDFKALSNLIVQNGSLSLINGMEITESEVDSYLERALSLSGGLI